MPRFRRHDALSESSGPATTTPSPARTRAGCGATQRCPALATPTRPGVQGCTRTAQLCPSRPRGAVRWAWSSPPYSSSWAACCSPTPTGRRGRRPPHLGRQDRHLLLRRKLRIRTAERLRRRPGHPLGERRGQGPAVAERRPRRRCRRHAGQAQLGGRVRQGVPDRDLRRRHHLDPARRGDGRERRHRRLGLPHRQGPLPARVRHRTRHRLRLLAVRDGGVRHARQRAAADRRLHRGRRR